MIGAHELREAGRLVDALGHAHEQGHAPKVVRQRRRIRQVVHGIDAGDEERLDFAARELGPQLGQVSVAPHALVRWPLEIERRAVRAG